MNECQHDNIREDYETQYLFLHPDDTEEWVYDYHAYDMLPDSQRSFTRSHCMDCGQEWIGDVTMETYPHVD